jgi:hypothetical protein
MGAWEFCGARIAAVRVLLPWAAGEPTVASSDTRSLGGNSRDITVNFLAEQ